MHRCGLGQARHAGVGQSHHHTTCVAISVGSTDKVSANARPVSFAGRSSWHDGSEGGDAMADPVGDIIGDYRGFAAMQHERLLARGIDIRPYPLSHLAVRVPDWDQYGTRTARWLSGDGRKSRSEEHTSELQSRSDLVCRPLL